MFTDVFEWVTSSLSMDAGNRLSEASSIVLLAVQCCLKSSSPKSKVLQSKV